MSKDIHIVYNPNRDDVLGRLARALAEGTGWTLAKTPRASAALNYWMIYIGYAQKPYDKTETACWFSHHEPHIPKKAEWWDIAARGVDIRTTTAPMYHEMLAPLGPTYFVHPPVDAQFSSNRKFRIGISGYVHPGGRKGESLIQRLQQGLPATWELVATGKGWGNIAPERELEWSQMPDWYRGIDILVCPSSIEGVPMPPLEALAMNKPIVIPYGVGMLDSIDLDEKSGVYRYVAGSFDSLWQALNNAYYWMQERITWASRYSVENWARQHRYALEGVEYSFPDAVPMVVLERPNLPQIQANKPIQVDTPNIIATKRYKLDFRAITVYIAYGDNARNMAVTAIQSWKQHMSSPVCLISDAPLNAGEDIFIEHPDTDIGARSVKTRLYDLVPAEYTHILYLDADTEIVADVGFLFRCLEDGYDFAICMNPEKYFSIGQHLRPDNREETDYTTNLVGHDEMLLFNGGVWSLRRNERTAAFMKVWHDEWQRWGARDQMSLLRAMYNSPMKICYLTQAFNTIVRYTPAHLTAGIIHHPQSARRWTGAIDGRLDSDTAWEAVKRYEREHK